MIKTNGIVKTIEIRRAVLSDEHKFHRVRILEIRIAETNPDGKHVIGIPIDKFELVTLAKNPIDEIIIHLPSAPRINELNPYTLHRPVAFISAKSTNHRNWRKTQLTFDGIDKSLPNRSLTCETEDGNA